MDRTRATTQVFQFGPIEQKTSICGCEMNFECKFKTRSDMICWVYTLWVLDGGHYCHPPDWTCAFAHDFELWSSAKFWYFLFVLWPWRLFFFTIEYIRLISHCVRVDHTIYTPHYNTSLGSCISLGSKSGTRNRPWHSVSGREHVQMRLYTKSDKTPIQKMESCLWLKIKIVSCNKF